MSDARTLSEAIEHLSTTAQDVGLDPAVARAEGWQLAAAVAESNRQAFVEWAGVQGLEPDAESFMVAAQAGRRWRSAPTRLLQEVQMSRPTSAASYAAALAEVCTSAAVLGEPGPRSMGNAQAAAAAQLGAVTGQATRSSAGDAGVGSRSPEPLRSTDAPAAGETPDVGVLQRVLDQLQGSIARQQRELATNLSRSPLDLDPDTFGPGAFSGLPGSPVAADPTHHMPPEAPLPGAVPSPSAAPRADVRADATQHQTDAKAAEQAEEEPEETRSVEELLAELDDLTGLTRVKKEIHQQSAVLRVEGLRKDAGLNVPTVTRHLVFVGNPGTGKTTVARLVAGIYKALGLLSKGQLVEVDRSELVAGYVGQTALKTAKVVESAKGGVLFIDEAYSLSGDQYGTEAINTLVKEMEDHRDDLVVIVAGYPQPMKVFIAENPGLASRFRTTIEFDDYTDSELVEIFTGMVARADYDASDETVERFKTVLATQPRDESFGNGRFVRNCLEAAIGAHAWRLREVTDPTLEDLRTLIPEDLDGLEKEEELPDLSLFQQHVGVPLEPPEEDPAGADIADDDPSDEPATVDITPPAEDGA